MTTKQAVHCVPEAVSTTFVQNFLYALIDTQKRGILFLIFVYHTNIYLI